MGMKRDWENKLSAISEEKNQVRGDFEEVKVKYEKVKSECAEKNQRNKVIKIF